MKASAGVDEAKIIYLMRAAREKRRGYADHFGWNINRDLEEWGVILALMKSMDAAGTLFFSNVKHRGRPNDPPDCEAVGEGKQRLAIEVTELVDGRMVCKYKQAQKNGEFGEYAEWSRQKFIEALADCIAKKDERFPELKDQPYPDGYVVVIYTDEPSLPRNVVEGYLNECFFKKPTYIDRVLLLLSPDPTIDQYPYFELNWDN